MKYERNNFASSRKKSNQFIFFFGVNDEKENFWTMNLFLFFSLSLDLQWLQTNKQNKKKILNYIFKQSKKERRNKNKKVCKD